MTASNSRELRRLQTRARILEGAVRVFAELGFDAASMGEIARRSGVKKALVQYHFETKDNLWREAMLHLWQQLEEAFPHYVSDVEAASSPEQVRAVFRQVLRFARDHRAWMGIVFRESAYPGPRLDWLIEHCMRKNFDDGLRFIGLAQQAGVLPQGSPLHLLHIISGALFYVMLVAPMTHRVTGVCLTDEEQQDALLDQLMHMLRPD